MSKRSKLKRDARQAKCKMRHRAYETNVNYAGGLFVFDSAYARGEQKTQLRPDQVTEIALAAWICYANIASGQISTADDWGMVASSINTALMLSEMGYGREHEAIFVRAQEGLTRAWKFGKRTGQWRFDGPAINDIRDALELHDQQIEIATKADFKNALLEVHRRIASGNTYQVVA